MRISDLPDPITAAKSDWLVASSWIGFTPTSEKIGAEAQCQATINRQFGKGYVVEYITAKFGDPNPGFEKDPQYLAEQEQHAHSAGRLVAVHRLRPTARSLRDIVGDADFERMQDMWAEDGKRRRWSVAFPIIESYAITSRPKANRVFSAEAMNRLFAHPSATLRPLNDDERAALSDLPIERRETSNAWIAIEDEIQMAKLDTTISPAVVRNIDHDLGASAIEGMTAQRWANFRLRAAWLANLFVNDRKKAGRLQCDHCEFDPVARLAGRRIAPRSIMDVHHKFPLEEGKRRTTKSDFALLCPTCHRIEHALARVKAQQS